ncbi:alpha/beta hydrolase [Streptantibioticus cattleyicolor]|uniref:Platelet-activating factor acetylhydrolase plasma/intracellular isoform II n=1 Tax=Streptantibioticus cattleyicolor (strain ATCC 35852 / DSM 46488 / JCM 4925 / NBRC 14057 / NRRL 8057) TaxID=1003195 RepID=F8JN92_STREN|nr:acetylhydrolase [Streptantibioticus cattleyicolor]AEW99148.1 Platelet-activating factor acetylhydrolase plasma/intracellular isoform II [Streptantibioticus cattleyicolor NRRL 8057 = DSM 46488]CCB71808.1 Platelet-activating factor acetylhydrolase, plasma/intracellular isoform II [Streptantibioticus cattleyicolor NRRL 8057 = DSM 46488]
MAQDTEPRGYPVGRRTLLKGAALAAAPPALAAAPARAQSPATGLVPPLPVPTGPHPVGVTALHLVDHSRPDPWEAIPVREVMVTVHYPARAVDGRPLARVFSPGAARVFGEIDAYVHHLPASGVDWAAVTGHAHLGAPALGHRRPVLLHSPGGLDPRTIGTSFAEELASHGYVVVTVDHPGDAGEVEFPYPTAYRGTVRTTVFRGDPRADPALFRTAIDTRLADLRFVLGRLRALAAGADPDAERRPLPEGLGHTIDPARIGVYGHSAGGTVAAETLHHNRDVRAAVNLEGYLDQPGSAPGRPGPLYPVAEHGVDRPLLLVATEGFGHRAELERSWSALLARSPRHVTRRRLDHTAHWIFTDYAAYAPWLRAAGVMAPADRAALVGTADPAVSVPLVRGVLRAFFARHLPVC